MLEENEGYKEVMNSPEVSVSIKEVKFSNKKVGNRFRSKHSINEK